MKIKIEVEIPDGNVCNYNKPCLFLNKRVRDYKWENSCLYFKKNVYLSFGLYRKCNECRKRFKMKKLKSLDKVKGK